MLRFHNPSLYWEKNLQSLVLLGFGLKVMVCDGGQEQERKEAWMDTARKVKD